MVNTTCAVRDCLSSSRINKDLRFHQFPRTEERCLIWVKACRRPDLVERTLKNLKNTYICSLHFERCMYRKKSLKKTAIPTLLLPTQDSIHTQTAEQPHSSTDTNSERLPCAQYGILQKKENIDDKTQLTTNDNNITEYMTVNISDETESESEETNDFAIKDEESMNDPSDPIACDNAIGTSSTEARRTKRNKRRCVVPGCMKNSFLNPDLKFFCLPLSKERRALWLKNLCLKDKKVLSTHFYVCELHFDSEKIYYKNNRKLLVRSAAPLLRLSNDGKAVEPPDEPADLVPELSTVKMDVDTFAATASSHDYVLPQIRNQPYTQEQESHELNVIIEEESKNLTGFVNHTNEDEILNVCDHMEPAPAPGIVQVKKSKTTRKKYTTDFKMFALGLYFKTPNAYRLLRGSFRLPRILTLHRMVVPTTTEVSDSLLRALKLKVSSMTKPQRCCMLCVSTMRLTPNIDYDALSGRIIGLDELVGVQTLEAATVALIVTVRGIFHNWKQVVAFSFLKQFQGRDNVKRFIDEIILKMFQIGLEICVYMSDRETDVITGASDREISKKNPSFKMYQRNIFFMYDPLYLLMEIRDILIDHNIIYFNDISISWSYIEACYYRDVKQKVIRLAPKLTEDHLKKRGSRPEKGLIDELKLVTDVFSLSTARGIWAYAMTKTLPKEAKTTAQWIITLSKLTDMLNFSTINTPEDKSRAFTGDPDHIKFLVEFYRLFNQLGQLNLNSSPGKAIREVMDAYCITINAFILLYRVLSTDPCWYPLVGLSRDCLHEFFAKVSHKHGNMPTAKEILTCITDFPVFNVLQFPSTKRSPNDMEKFMSEARQMPNIEMYEEISNDRGDMFENYSAEFNRVELPTERKLEFLSLYMLFKALQRHKDSVEMHLYVCREGLADDSEHVMSPVAFRTEIGMRINMVPRNFLDFVKLLEHNFMEYMKGYNLTKCYKTAGWLDFVKNVTYKVPFDNFPLDYIKHCYLQFRLSLVMKHNNRLFKENRHQKVFVVELKTLS